jgi:hypothetical protein
MAMLTARLIPGFVVWLWLMQAAGAGAVQTNPLLGAWHSSVSVKGKTPLSVDLVFLPDGRFGERTKYKADKHMRFGRYQLVRMKNIHFKVSNWLPRRACTRVGCEPINIDYQILSLSSNKLVLREKSHAAIHFQRVPQAPMKNATPKPK